MSDSKKSHTQINTLTHNEAAWDHQALLQHDWSKPVSSELIEAAKKGQWEVHITKKPIPESWLPKNIQGKDILCLASAGGQQAPVLAAAGANVTVFDKNKELEDQGLLRPKYPLPYADIKDLPQNMLDDKVKNKEAFVFGHSLLSQIDGQLEAGFLLSAFYEDEHRSPRFLIEEYLPTMIATRAIKL